MVWGVWGLALGLRVYDSQTCPDEGGRSEGN